MIKTINILMIDDHPIILEGYRNVLRVSGGPSKFRIDTANSCDEAYLRIKNSEKRPYDIVFLDIGLPPSRNEEFLCGEDLGLMIKETSPDTKIIVLTMFNDNIRLLSILKNLNPQGFLIKSDVTPSVFLEAFHHVLEGREYSSNTIEVLMRKRVINDFTMDKEDHQILMHLSRGLRTNALPEVIPISLASIEKRKKNLREIFKVDDGRDIVLINKARELGFL